MEAPTPACAHFDQLPVVQPGSEGCEACLATGSWWVHLRMCLNCGHVGCCDQSPNRHARAHFATVGHPVMRSQEPGEAWAWCWIDEVDIDL
jgi:uncharacterized UBP type Zn finger protein